MDVSWVKPRNWQTNRLGPRVRDAGDQIQYRCPSMTVTYEGDRDQYVTCIWHRQTDTMLWWPQQLLPCNSEYPFFRFDEKSSDGIKLKVNT